MNKKHIYITNLFLIISGVTFTQEISKEVYVTSSFKPEIEKAEKINHLPEVDDTVSVKPAVDIEIMPSRVKTEYEVRPIKPAKIVANPLDKLYNSYLKLGFGSQVTPLAEFSIQNLRSKKYAYGGYAMHKSSNRKDIKLGNDLYVSDKYSKNTIGGFGKMFLNDVTLSTEASFQSYAFHYYGINTADSLTNDDLPNDVFNKQRYSNLKFKAGLNSNKPDSSALQYHFNFLTNYFYDKKDNAEGQAGFNTGAGYYISDFLAGFDLDFNYAKFNPDAGSNRFNVTWNINPSVKKRKEEWEFKIGAKLTHNRSDTTRWYFYPDAYLRFYVLPEILQMYFGLGGNLEENYYEKLAGENPYILPGLTFLNTNHRLIGYGGIMGKLSSKGGYKIDLRFDAMENNYYYILQEQGTRQPENVFINRNDDADLISLSTEFNYAPFSYLNFLLRNQYNIYKVVQEKYPYQKPKLSSNFITNYNFNEKIYARLDIIFIGKRYALLPTGEDDDYEELPAIVDINLGGEYRYSNVLSFFINFNNILGNKYEYWVNYPTQGFNMMLGLSYKL